MFCFVSNTCCRNLVCLKYELGNGAVNAPLERRVSERREARKSRERGRPVRCDGSGVDGGPEQEQGGEQLRKPIQGETPESTGSGF